MGKAKPKQGERRDIGKIATFIARIRATVTRPLTEDGEEIREPFKVFSWSGTNAGSAISLQVEVFGPVPPIQEITCFDPSGDDGLFSAFQTGITFDPIAFDYAKFQTPEIGDYVKISGVHYQKWTVLSESPDPRLRAGFWKDCCRCYNTTQFIVRKRPPMPKGKALLKVKAV